MLYRKKTTSSRSIRHIIAFHAVNRGSKFAIFSILHSRGRPGKIHGVPALLVVVRVSANLHVVVAASRRAPPAVSASAATATEAYFHLSTKFIIFRLNTFYFFSKFILSSFYSVFQDFRRQLIENLQV